MCCKTATVYRPNRFQKIEKQTISKSAAKKIDKKAKIFVPLLGKTTTTNNEKSKRKFSTHKSLGLILVSLPKTNSVPIPSTLRRKFIVKLHQCLSPKGLRFLVRWQGLSTEMFLDRLIRVRLDDFGVGFFFCFTWERGTYTFSSKIFCAALTKVVFLFFWQPPWIGCQ